MRYTEPSEMPNGFGHRPAGPVSGFVRQLGAGYCHHARRGFRPEPAASFAPNR
jgi:hypothetical protein